jgi:hypothetical protein
MPDLSTDLLPSGSEVQGPVMDVLGTLLGDFEARDAILEIFRQLVADNAQMSRRLTRLAARFKTSEKISGAQLILFVDALRRGEGGPGPADLLSPTDDVGAAAERLCDASGINDEPQDNDEGGLSKRHTNEPPPPRRVSAPAHLRRIDNPRSRRA